MIQHLFILAYGFGGTGVVFFIAYCAGGSWGGGRQSAVEDDLKHPATETLKEMEL